MQDNERSEYELFIGLVGAIGTDLDAVTRALTRAFEAVNYSAREIRLIELVEDLDQRWKLPRTLKGEELYKRRMDAGNELRGILDGNDALVLLAMAAIRDQRRRHHPVRPDAKDGDSGDRPIARCAYLLRSLKTPQEIETLRRVYGSNCLIIAAYASKKDREKSLAEKIAKSHFAFAERFTPAARELMLRDEKEHGEEHGQNVIDTFCMADAFLNASADPDMLERDARRLVELLFGHPFQTPTREEAGMFQAHGAGLRSASKGRQVGAAIATPDGDIIAVGTNEVAKAFGGQYWPEDGADHRDHKRKVDSSAAMTQNIVADLLVRLKRKGWLADALGGLDAHTLLSRSNEDELLKALPSRVAEEEGLPSLAEKARVRDVIEFFRAVHAEMAALMAAARRGIAVDGCTLYSTTFPCHECAKHIVAAGIRRVVFISPYPKSRVADMYDDSISVDDPSDHARVTFQPFVGIAPRRYVELFTAPETRGSEQDWESIKREQDPRLGDSILSYVYQENDYVEMLKKLLIEKGLRRSAGDALHERHDGEASGGAQ